MLCWRGRDHRHGRSSGSELYQAHRTVGPARIGANDTVDTSHGIQHHRSSTRSIDLLRLGRRLLRRSTALTSLRPLTLILVLCRGCTLRAPPHGASSATHYPPPLDEALTLKPAISTAQSEQRTPEVSDHVGDKGGGRQRGTGRDARGGGTHTATASMTIAARTAQRKALASVEEQREPGREARHLLWHHLLHHAGRVSPALAVALFVLLIGCFRFRLLAALACASSLLMLPASSQAARRSRRKVEVLRGGHLSPSVLFCSVYFQARARVSRPSRRIFYRSSKIDAMDSDGLSVVSDMRGVVRWNLRSGRDCELFFCGRRSSVVGVRWVPQEALVDGRPQRQTASRHYL